MSSNSVTKRNFEFDKLMVTAFLGVLSFFLLPQLDITEWTLTKSILISFSIAFLSLGALTWYAWVVKEDSIVVDFLTPKAEEKPEETTPLDLTKPKNSGTGITMSPPPELDKRVRLFCIACLLTSMVLFLVFMMYPAPHKNYLKATINNESCMFTLMGAVKGPVGQGETNIGAVYYYITPHGDVRYTLIFQMDGSMGVGNYEKHDEQSKIRIVLTKGFIFDLGLSNNTYVASIAHQSDNPMTDAINAVDKSDFHFEITSRDKKWEHYQGNFNAKLQLSGGNVLEGEILEINSAEFDFSITKNIAPPVEE